LTPEDLLPPSIHMTHGAMAVFMKSVAGALLSLNSYKVLANLLHKFVR